jgi:hypothetical protein
LRELNTCFSGVFFVIFLLKKCTFRFDDYLVIFCICCNK